ncbi:hypothetical protein T4D_6919 [Trichinella pseudospiralis]|uniref:Uncharacterized protein n=1 Tax=Trichinella pseudospiralis TaxID=6337 RepID=A0A0V1FZ72_TRIPS|nr:hypothetical protein T4D_6919 [Trichinella pseudospiralis]
MIVPTDVDYRQKKAKELLDGENSSTNSMFENIFNNLKRIKLKPTHISKLLPFSFLLWPPTALP